VQEQSSLEVTVIETAKPRRARPSSLQMARLCERNPWLSIRYPASRAATRFGSAVDQQVSTVISCIASGAMESLPSEEDLLVETSKILDWLENNYPIEQWEWHVQERVELLDPETGEVLTGGTPDLLCLHRAQPRFVCIDWKKRGQLWAGHLQKPDVNDQQLAYVTAFWLKLARMGIPIGSAKIILAAWDDTGVYPMESSDITEDRLTEVVEAIRAVPPVDVDGPQPEASVGDHCDHCYVRMHCSEHLLPMAVAVQAGLPAPFAEFVGQPLTAKTAATALGWLESATRVLREAKKIVELVEGNVDAFVTQNGPVQVGEMMYGPQLVKGKRAGATVKTLEKEGLQRLVRAADEKVKCKWYPAPKRE
jgi:hypothetical protein